MQGKETKINELALSRNESSTNVPKPGDERDDDRAFDTEHDVGRPDNDGTEENSGEAISVECINIILSIPKDTVALTMEATFLNDDESLQKATQRLSISDLHDARHDCLEHYEISDKGEFVMTKGCMDILKKVLNMLEGINDSE